jgi:hypothetical protein
MIDNLFSLADHTFGIRRRLIRLTRLLEIMHFRPGHLAGSIEGDPFLDRKYRRLHRTVEHGRRHQLHPLFGYDITGNLALTHHGARMDFGGNHRIFSNNQRPSRLNFPIHPAINADSSFIRNSASERDAFAYKGNDLTILRSFS